MGSSEVVGFTRVRLSDGFIRNRCVHSGDPWRSLGSSGVIGFTRVRPGGVSVYAWSVYSIGCALGLDGFILGR